MGPLGDEELLRALKSAEGFGLGVPISGVEDPIVPSALLHDVFLWGWTASGLAKVPSKVARDGDSSNCKAGVKGASLDGSDQSSEQSVARVLA